MKWHKIEVLLKDEKINELIMNINNLRFTDNLWSSKRKFIINEEKYNEINSSNTIENIIVKTSRNLFSGAKTSFSKNEKEWMGLNNAYSFLVDKLINDKVTLDSILELHNLLGDGDEKYNSGKYKNTEIFINSYKNGEFTHAISTVSPKDTPDELKKSFNTYHKNIIQYPQYKILATLLFVGEFLSIHPFNDGNGRISRLLMIWLLSNNDYQVGKYISLSKSINDRKEKYYEVLQIKTDGIVSDDYSIHTIAPWIVFNLEVILNSYKQAEYITSMNNKDRIWKIMLELNSFTISEIMKEAVVPRSYAKDILAALLKDRKIIKHGQKKGTKYKIAKSKEIDIIK